MTSSTQKPDKIAVVIRVFSRISDANALIRIIQKNWKCIDKEIFVLHNGESSGFPASDLMKSCGHYVNVTFNSGHRTGARDLVQTAVKVLAGYSEFTHYLFIESDCWVLNDKTIVDALRGMKKFKKPCASYIWVAKRRSYAVDFFIVESRYAHSHPALFTWDAHPERYFSKVAQYDTFIFNDMGIVHAPSMLKRCKISPLILSNGRFRIFPNASALTHHLEEMGCKSNEEALTLKKSLANALSGVELFPNVPVIKFPKDLIWKKISKYIPQSSWFHFWIYLPKKWF